MLLHRRPQVLPRGTPHACTCPIITRHSRRPQHTSICRSTSSSSSGSGSGDFGGSPAPQEDPVQSGAPPQPSKLRRSSSSTGSQGAAAAETKESLQQDLKKAIAAEDYSTAAQLKQQIMEIEMQDPLVGLKWALEAAIAEERYADAAVIRDQIKEIEDANKPQPPDMQGLTTSSDTVTGGIRVKVRSYYVPAQSRPELGQYFFAYAVTISNESQQVVMLESRHWVITDGSGKIDHVRGPGVVGEQPILHPGQTYEYQSACPLFTTFGTMEGEYEMVLIDEHGERVTSQDRKVVEIGRFALIKPETA